MWRCDSSVDLTQLRQAGLVLENGGIYSRATARAALDLTGTQGVIFRKFKIVGDATVPPLTAALLTRGKFPSGTGTFGGAGLHDLRGLEIEGEYSGAGLINYGSEVNNYGGMMCVNRAKNRSNPAAIITGSDTYLSKWVGAVASDFVTGADFPTGVLSCINHSFGFMDIRRPSNWGALSITSVTNASPALITLDVGTTEIVNSDLTFIHDWTGMSSLAIDQQNLHLKKITDTTYELYSDVGLTVPVDTTAAGTFTGGNLWASSGPGLVIAGGASDIKNTGGYVLNYGADAVVIDSENGTVGCDDIDLSFQHEARPVRSVRFVSPSTGTVTHSDVNISIMGRNQSNRDAVIAGEQKGTGKVTLRGARLSKDGMVSVPALGFFATPAVFNLVNCEVKTPLAASWNGPHLFNTRFTGLVESYDDNMVRDYRRGKSMIIAQSATPQSHTGDTTETTLHSITLDAGDLGADGILVIRSLWAFAGNNANVKTARVKLGATVYEEFAGANKQSGETLTRVYCVDSANQKAAARLTPGFDANLLIGVTSTVNLLFDQTILWTAQLADVTDILTLEAYSVEVKHG